MAQQKLAIELDLEALQRAGERVDPELDQTISGGPLPLPYCAYPKARDVAQHGVQHLPASLPLVDFARA